MYKFNKSLNRSLKLKKRETPSNNQCFIDFEIKIRDSGCGISEENISKLFMNFGKLEEHSSMNSRGTGLGLSICKSLIEMMGGSVRAESQQGVGTTFIVQLKTKCKRVSMRQNELQAQHFIMNVPLESQEIEEESKHSPEKDSHHNIIKRDMENYYNEDYYENDSDNSYFL
mmetsp:Transcript_26595/g.25677  ORF Transcript_26595/g.25677 Transcript_26595/m.25677 type:complete len:171 (+) Transcript_26595:207-719(+)|eukprot:CAMPEP_0170566428 /NCGR_PEP_ID=MMETSP0211-20121228/79833_1 /TAXON_ID=311385 /ORGANISM="Pseudokeronopsis sp., Strain OXSARD2" /LENGTH=170 /DNA_ID=CAMNT_0010887603 /DNA_START=690 /DNA_END=1202 /DNA_ORIENTATION=-